MVESDAAYEAWGKTGVALCETSLREIAALCRARAIPFDLVIYPWPTQLQSATRGRGRKPCFDFAKASGIPVIDLFPAFRALKDWPGYYIYGDVHWNEKGHAFVARRLADSLVY